MELRRLSSLAVPVPALVKGGSVIYRYADDRKSQRNIHARNGIPRMFLLLLGFQSLTVIAKNLCDLLQIKLDIFSFSPENWTGFRPPAR